MPTPYAGNPALFPASFDIPSDGDPRTASSVNAALEALGDRTAYLQSTRLAVVSADHVQAPASFSWPNTTGNFGVSEQAPIKDLANSNTPFTSATVPGGIQPGDIIDLDFNMCVLISSSATGNAYQWQFRLVYSESATDFVSGTWAPVMTTYAERLVMGVASPTYPTILNLGWNVRVVAAGGTGHMRFAIQAHRFGDETADLSSYSAGRYRWWRIT